MNTMTVGEVVSKNTRRYALTLTDSVLGTCKVGEYARRQTALRGARRLLQGRVSGRVVQSASGNWGATAVLANGTAVPLKFYRRRETAWRGINRFSNRLAKQTVVV